MTELGIWIKIKYCLQKTHFKDIEYLVEKWKKTYHANTNSKKADRAILIANNVNIKTGRIIWGNRNIS